MGSDSEFLDFIALLVGVILLVRALAQMERYHALRVAILTVILSCIAIYLYNKAGVLGQPASCVIEIRDDGAYF